MEGLAAAASIIAIMGVGKCAIKCAKFLVRAAQDTASCSADLKMFAVTMRAFANALKLTKVTLDELIPRLKGKSRIIEFIRKGRVMETLKTSADMLATRLSQFRQRISNLMRKSPLSSRIGWIKWNYFDKFEFNLLNSQMQVIHGGMDLVHLSLQLTNALCSPQTEDIKADMYVAPFSACPTLVMVIKCLV
jgi:hypothetical protein